MAYVFAVSKISAQDGVKLRSHTRDNTVVQTFVRSEVTIFRRSFVEINVYADRPRKKTSDEKYSNQTVTRPFCR